MHTGIFLSYFEVTKSKINKNYWTDMMVHGHKSCIAV